jgi:MFS family permease
MSSPQSNGHKMTIRTHTQTIPLAVRESVSLPESEIERGPTPEQFSALPPISHRKQAAVLFSAFATIALTIGYNQCFGVFQEFYLSPSQDVLTPSPSQQATPPTALLAFVGTLCYGLTWAGGIMVSPVMARIEQGRWATTMLSSKLWRYRLLRLLTPRTITISGVLLMCAGFLLASFSRSLWELLLTQGFLVGFGMSLLYFPLLAPAPEYFTKHRATAMGFVSVPSRKSSRGVNLTRMYICVLTYFIDLSRRWYWWSRILTDHPSASQFSRWSMDS